MHLTKSDFKTAQECATKLFYKKQGMPQASDTNEYLRLLADGGYMVHKMAQLLFPTGILVGNTLDSDAAIEATQALLQLDEVVIFEATLKSKGKLVRVDILHKYPGGLRLYEVKSKSFSSQKFEEASRSGQKYFGSEWKPYLEDAAFQKLVLAELYPESPIETFLLLPDTSKTTDIDGLIGWFPLREIVHTNGFRSVEVDFAGDADQLRRSHILTEVQVDAFIEPMMAMVTQNAWKYLNALLANEPITVPISAACQKCDYTTTNETFPHSGFSLCWKELADVKPHLLELAQLGNLNRSRNKPIDALITQGRVCQTDLPADQLIGKYNNRPYYQVYQREEVFDREAFCQLLDTLTYPLHFLDFETSQMAVPYHAGMRPYGKVIFQWSCHTIAEPGSAPVHSEWINTDHSYPNYDFAESLREQVGQQGTLLIWSKYEITVLRELQATMAERGDADPALKNWLDTLLADQENRFLDMHAFTVSSYFHPAMGGKTSIKVTLPAVLQAINPSRAAALLEPCQLLSRDEQGALKNPYSLLPTLEILGQPLDVSNGTEAMRAYQDMMFGLNRDNAQVKEAIKQALLAYCHLDTLAMVLIWEYWAGLCEPA
jgi:hypothetical protein